MKQQFENVFSFLDEIGKEIDKKHANSSELQQGGGGMSGKNARTVEVVLTVDVVDGGQITNEIIATFFNWEICHIVKEESEGDLSVQKIIVREKLK